MTCTHCNKPADDCDCETMAGIHEAAAGDEAYVLLKGGMYWKLDGYTGRLADAWKFNKLDAAALVESSVPGTLIPLSTAPRHAPKCDPHVIALDLKADAAKAFEAERAARVAAEAERDRLRKALAPFSDMADEMVARGLSKEELIIVLDNPNDSHRLYAENFLTARAALKDAGLQQAAQKGPFATEEDCAAIGLPNRTGEPSTRRPSMTEEDRMEGLRLLATAKAWSRANKASESYDAESHSWAIIAWEKWIEQHAEALLSPAPIDWKRVEEIRAEYAELSDSMSGGYWDDAHDTRQAMHRLGELLAMIGEKK